MAQNKYKEEASRNAQRSYGELIDVDRALDKKDFGEALAAMHRAGVFEEAVTWNCILYQREGHARAEVTELDEWLGATVRSLREFRTQIAKRFKNGHAAGRAQRPRKRG